MNKLDKIIFLHDNAETTEDHETIEKMMDKLTEKERDFLELHFLMDEAPSIYD